MVKRQPVGLIHREPKQSLHHHLLEVIVIGRRLLVGQMLYPPTEVLPMCQVLLGFVCCKEARRSSNAVNGMRDRNDGNVRGTLWRLGMGLSVRHTCFAGGGCQSCYPSGWHERMPVGPPPLSFGSSLAEPVLRRNQSSISLVGLKLGSAH